MYDLGQGLPQDSVLAYALYNLSAANDSSAENPATKNRDVLAQQLPPNQLAEGQALTLELMKPGNFARVLDARLSKTTP